MARPFQSRMGSKRDRIISHSDGKTPDRHKFAQGGGSHDRDERAGNRFGHDDRHETSANKGGSNNSPADRAPQPASGNRFTNYGNQAPRTERRSYDNPAPSSSSYSQDRPRFGNDRPRFDRSQSAPSSDRPSYSNYSNSSRPSSDRPAYGSSNRPTSDRSFEKRSYDRPQKSFDRPSYSRSAPSYDRQDRASSDKPSFAPRSQSQRPSQSSFSQSDSSQRPVNSFAMSETRLKGVFEFKGNLYTQNAVPGKVVYGEKTYNANGVEFRQWDVMRSKLAAGIKRGVSQIGIKPGCTVLYLGCSTGTTVSHVAEIVGEQGIVYALDVAPRVMRDLVLLSKQRHNIYPLMADANRPTTFSHAVPEVDVIFMDISQQNQTEIFLKNVHAFLKPGGFALLSLKTRSIDITQSPKQIYDTTRAELEKELTLVDFKTLDPYEKDHALFVCKKD